MRSWFAYARLRTRVRGWKQPRANVFVLWRTHLFVSFGIQLLLLLLSSRDDVSLLGAAAVGAKPMEAAASGSGILQGVVDAVANAIAVVEDVCARASNL